MSSTVSLTLIEKARNLYSIHEKIETGKTKRHRFLYIYSTEVEQRAGEQRKSPLASRHHRKSYRPAYSPAFFQAPRVELLLCFTQKEGKRTFLLLSES